MKEQKHTPGPWHVGTQPDTFHTIFSESGRMRLEKEGTCLYPVAKTIDFEGEDGEANARLIAAAPELLETCKMMLWLIESEQWEKRFDGETTILRTAIAKAEGN